MEFNSFDDKSLEFEPELLKTTNVHLNYYPIVYSNVEHTSSHIHSIYRGNANNPNIAYSKESVFPTYYQCSDLYFQPKLHDGNHNFELIIKHTPISSSLNNLYVVFLLHQTNSQDQHSNQHNEIDSMLQSITSDNTRELFSDFDVSTILGDITKLTTNLYETSEIEGGINCIVMTVDKPIYITANIPSFIKQPSLFNVKNHKSFKTNPLCYSSIEGYVTVKGSGDQTGYAMDDNGNEMVCEIIPDKDSGNILMQQIPLSDYFNKSNMDFVMIVAYASVSLFIFFVILIFAPNLFSMIDTALLKKGSILGGNLASLPKIFWIFSIAIFIVIILLLILGKMFDSGTMIVYSIFIFISWIVALYGSVVKSNIDSGKKTETVNIDEIANPMHLFKNDVNKLENVNKLQNIVSNLQRKKDDVNKSKNDENVLTNVNKVLENLKSRNVQKTT